jgi:Flp pilus assembly protein TadG
MVEFALVSPIALLVLFGSIAGSYLFFQSEAVNNGARGGARWATIQAGISPATYLYTNTGANKPFCESSALTTTIVTEVRKAAPILPLNGGRLCTPAVGAAFSTTELRQPIDNSKAYIVLDALPTLSSPNCITISVVYVAPSLGKPLPATITIEGHSGAPVAPNGSANCPPAFTPP